MVLTAIGAVRMGDQCAPALEHQRQVMLGGEAAGEAHPVRLNLRYREPGQAAKLARMRRDHQGAVVAVEQVDMCSGSKAFRASASTTMGSVVPVTRSRAKAEASPLRGQPRADGKDLDAFE